MEFEISPYVGVGPIVFGLARAEVRRHLGGPVHTFMKSAASVAPTDVFEDFDLHVYYDADDRCEAAEFGKGHARRHADPTFRGRRLVGQLVLPVQRWLSTIDPDVRTIGGSTISFGFGFGVHASSADSEATIQDVIVFRRGYYDGHHLSFKPLKLPPATARTTKKNK
jgi:hypothetical protein